MSAGIVLCILVPVGFLAVILRNQDRNQTQLLNAVSKTTSDIWNRLRGQEAVQFSMQVDSEDEDEATSLHDSLKIANPNDQGNDQGKDQGDEDIPLVEIHCDNL